MMQDTRRFVSITYILGAVLIAWFFVRVLGSVLELAAPGTDRALFAGIQLSVLGGAAIGLGLSAWLWKNASVHAWVTDVCDQLLKVTWPTGEETRKSTITVIIFSVILGCVLAVMDLAGREAIDLVFKIFS